MMIEYPETPGLLLPAEAALILGLFLAVFITSLFEKENRAAILALLAGIILSTPFFLFGQLEVPGPSWIMTVIKSIPPVVILSLFFPFRGRAGYIPGNPVLRFDERDSLFSRAELEPGTERYESYYRRRPGNKTGDDEWRQLPGLLRSGSRYYDPILFAAANSIFGRIVDDLHPRVEGAVSDGRSELNDTAGNSRRMLGMEMDWGPVAG